MKREKCYFSVACFFLLVEVEDTQFVILHYLTIFNVFLFRRIANMVYGLAVSFLKRLTPK